MPDSPQYLYQVPRIHDGLEFLIENDPVFRKSGIRTADIKREYVGPGFSGLVRIVIGQQVSTQAADSMWQKFRAGMPAITPNAVLILNADELRSFGLSHQKARYIRDLAQAINDKKFDPLALDHHPDDEVYRQITALKGFGPWSAEMFLMFCLARPDVWPSGDLGIQEGLRIYLKKDERPDAAGTKKLGSRFSPHRTAAALLLWHLKAISG